MAKTGEGLVRPRELLEKIWQRCLISGFVGRCYSKHKGHNSPIPGSNITLFDGEELVVIWQENCTGPILTARFVRTEIVGKFEQEIREVLEL
ncbi:MAG: hypothetical protein Athens101428_508 [Candidatus Berkelbacteria bacterium Athens1014_28]|uniref:Uncharacterized protein n=1 Tax=Candidatus Berkelbacteria bacterium Athens1014_28 TaxID=2017145 RepID=A0A554LM63_9BACT|nr:MAG: hypothetical protein Athens101428_508 [Candidatus Berkelbacteria bacterium Athens1014_28]